MRVLVTGGGGMLGHVVWETFHRRVETAVTLRQGRSAYAASGLFDSGKVFDHVEAPQVVDVITTFRPDFIVNCVGVVKQRSGAADPLQSIRVNSLLPHEIAAAATKIGAKLIQLSTDCVFSGRTGGYRESDLPDPPDLYGRSKLLGEVGAPHLTIRTSIIGRELAGQQGLLEWLLANRGRTVRGYTKAFFSGVTTTALAGILLEVLESSPGLTGIYHVSSERISKHDLLLKLDRALGLGITVEPDDALVIDRSLDSTAFRTAAKIAIPGWESMIDLMAARMQRYEEWRRT